MGFSFDQGGSGGGGGAVGALVDGPDPHEFANATERDAVQAGRTVSRTSLGTWRISGTRPSSGGIQLNVSLRELAISSRDTSGTDQTAVVGNQAGFLDRTIRIREGASNFRDVRITSFTTSGSGADGTTYFVYQFAEVADMGTLAVNVNVAIIPRETEGGPAWLAQYDANPGYAISLTDPDPDTYQVRRGGEWVDVAGSLIRGADGGSVTSVSSDATITGDGSTGSPLAVANPFTADDETKLDGVESNATADQTASEVRALLETLMAANRLDGAHVRETGKVTVSTGHPNAADGDNGDLHIETDASSNVTSLWRKASGTWGEHPVTGSGGGSITSGTADPTGGSSGDLYLKTNAGGQLVSIHLRTNTWNTITLPSGGGGTQFKGAWAAATTYARGDMVTRDSTLWIQYGAASRTSASAPPADPEHWFRLGRVQDRETASNYRSGDFVIGSDDRLYVCIKDGANIATDPTANPDDWFLFNPVRQGQAWNNARAYARGDVVFQDSKLWMCLAATSTGTNPTTSGQTAWLQIAGGSGSTIAVQDFIQPQSALSAGTADIAVAAPSGVAAGAETTIPLTSLGTGSILSGLDTAEDSVIITPGVYIVEADFKDVKCAATSTRFSVGFVVQRKNEDNSWTTIGTSAAIYVRGVAALADELDFLKPEARFAVTESTTIRVRALSLPFWGIPAVPPVAWTFQEVDLNFYAIGGIAGPEGPPGSGGSFTPSKTNLYAAVKAILEHNASVTADDTDSELDVAQFSPTQANIYDAVKAILVHNSAVTADDTDSELDITAGSGSAAGIFGSRIAALIADQVVTTAEGNKGTVWRYTTATDDASENVDFSPTTDSSAWWSVVSNESSGTSLAVREAVTNTAIGTLPPSRFALLHYTGTAWTMALFPSAGGSGTALTDVIAMRPMAPLCRRTTGTRPDIATLGTPTASASTTGGFQQWDTVPTNWNSVYSPPDATNTHAWGLISYQLRTRSGWQDSFLHYVVLEDAFVAGGGTLTDDAVLDLAKTTRAEADRGKYLGTSATDENELALLDAPSGGAVATGIRGDLIAVAFNFPTGTQGGASSIAGVQWQLATGDNAAPSWFKISGTTLRWGYAGKDSDRNIPSNADGFLVQAWVNTAATGQPAVWEERGHPLKFPFGNVRSSTTFRRYTFIDTAQRVGLQIERVSGGADIDLAAFRPIGGGSILPANLQLRLYWSLAGGGAKGDRGEAGAGFGATYIWQAKGATARFGNEFPNDTDPVSDRLRLEFKQDAPNERYHADADPASWWVANPTNLDSTGAPATSTARVVFKPPAGTWALALPFKISGASANAGLGLFEVQSGTDDEIIVETAQNTPSNGFGAAQQVTGRLESDELVTDGTREFYFMGRWSASDSANYYLRAVQIA